MGARLSQPVGPGGTTEASVPSKPAPPPTPAQPWGRRRLNSRTVVAPAAAATMALLLFVYARTSIRAAKTNAQRHRDADSGGEGLSLVNENRRRHGAIAKLEERSMLSQLAATAKEDLFGTATSNTKAVAAGSTTSSAARTSNLENKPTSNSGRSEEDRKLRSLTGKGG